MMVHASVSLYVCSPYVCFVGFLYVFMHVYMSVCPVIRVHIVQRILSKHGGNILRIMTCCMGYLYCFARVVHEWTGVCVCTAFKSVLLIIGLKAVMLNVY
jgi:hypothetical protein